MLSTRYSSSIAIHVYAYSYMHVPCVIGRRTSLPRNYDARETYGDTSQERVTRRLWA